MIAGIAQVRNEEAILGDTLEHFLGFCDRLYVYDDVSTDRTGEVLDAHPDVQVKHGTVWSRDRSGAERDNRQTMLELATADGADWICTFDADERLELPLNWQDYDAVRMKLFDFYITAEDARLPYTERRWLGPEYRQIHFLYRNGPHIKFVHHGQRDMWMFLQHKRTLSAGYVKHYGKAISVEEWEEACVYYTTYFGEPYRSKWEARKGGAIHTESDFGRPLITWDQKEQLGVPL